MSSFQTNSRSSGYKSPNTPPPLNNNRSPRLSQSNSCEANGSHHHHQQQQHTPQSQTQTLGSSNSSVTSISSAYSMTSTFRHHNPQSILFDVPNAMASSSASSTISKKSPPKPMLTSDINHHPKTRGSVGIMIVGLGGPHTTTMVAGIIANRLQIQWKGPQGQAMLPNYNGCVTQQQQQQQLNNETNKLYDNDSANADTDTGGSGVTGFKNRVSGLADASMAAVGGWVRL